MAAGDSLERQAPNFREGMAMEQEHYDYSRAARRIGAERRALRRDWNRPGIGALRIRQTLGRLLGRIAGLLERIDILSGRAGR